MGNGLLMGAMLGGIAGGAKANLDRINEEAEQERKMSYAKLLQQYGQDNIRLTDELATARENTKMDRDDKRTWETREYDQVNAEIKAKEDEANKNVDREDKWAALGFSADLADKLAARQDARADARLEADKDKPGEIGRLKADLVDALGEEEGLATFREIVATKKTTAKGGLTQSQYLEEVGNLRQEYEMAPESKGKDGGMFGKDIPPMPFEEWVREKRPESYRLLFSTKEDPAKKGLVESAQAKSDDGKPDQKTSTAPTKKTESLDKYMIVLNDPGWQPSPSTERSAATTSTNNLPATREEAIQAQKVAKANNIPFLEALEWVRNNLQEQVEQSRQAGGSGVTSTR